MLSESHDKRIRRSRRLLKEGLLSLLEQKDFKDITAKDITEQADLNRGTFYLHYGDTKELLGSIEDDIVSGIQAIIDEHIDEEEQSDSLAPVLDVLIDEIIAHRKTVHLLLQNSDVSALFEKLRELVYKNGAGIVQRKFAFSTREQVDYYLSFVSFGLVGIVKLWFQSDMSFPKETLIQYATDLCIRSSAAVLDAGTEGLPKL